MFSTANVSPQVVPVIGTLSSTENTTAAKRSRMADGSSVCGSCGQVTNSDRSAREHIRMAIEKLGNSAAYEDVAGDLRRCLQKISSDDGVMPGAGASPMAASVTVETRTIDQRIESVSNYEELQAVLGVPAEKATGPAGALVTIYSLPVQERENHLRQLISRTFHFSPNDKASASTALKSAVEAFFPMGTPCRPRLHAMINAMCALRLA